MKKKSILFIAAAALSLIVKGQTATINVDASAGRKAISPYIFGKNNNLSDDPGTPLTAAEWKMMRDAGLKFTRENGGNNSTKYNWKLHITSHPDWYNNVYSSNWDYAAKKLQDSLPGAQGMWGFQLIGKAASNTSNNFDDYAYNESVWWSGVLQNLAGGGIPNSGGGSVATTDGDPSLYLRDWPADSTVGILDHWFGGSGLGYDQDRIKYWSMDNEPDIWNSTHDDVMPVQPTAEEFMQLYFAVAKKARAKFPGIKLVGPIPASEWQWYAWNNDKITGTDGLQYTWLEFFIKRISEEETASGIRLLDVIDLHSYPNETNDSDIVQLHRIYFDTTYDYPGANGVKTTAASGWDNSITKEYVLERCNRWLDHYLGAGHGVAVGVSEYGFANNDANVTSVSYGSVLGTFADHGVEYFSPWDWFPGMWETLHLYSHYGKSTRVASSSSDEYNVSAYSSINETNDSLTVILVNRSQTASETVTLNMQNFSVPDGSYATRQLKELPASETFVSEASNALSSGTASVGSNSLTITLPKLSTTAILLKGTAAAGVAENDRQQMNIRLYPNPSSGDAWLELPDEKTGNYLMEIYSAVGELICSKQFSGSSNSKINIPLGESKQGVYIVHIKSQGGKNWTGRIVKF